MNNVIFALKTNLQMCPLLLTYRLEMIITSYVCVFVGGGGVEGG